LLRGSEEKYKDAVKDLEKSIQLSQDNHEAWVDLGGVYLMLKDYDSALMAFEKAIDIDKACPEGWYGKGLVALLKKEYKKAIEFLNAAIKIDPKHLNAILARAEAYIEFNQREEGLRDVKKAVSIKSDIFKSSDEDEDDDEDDDKDDYDRDEDDDLDEDAEIEELRLDD
jgi:tetratricopeptide (TPR) repeat protein